METPNTVDDLKIIVLTKMKEVPDKAELTVAVWEAPIGLFTVHFKFKTKKGKDDYWFKWLNFERPEKILSYLDDSHNYIMKQLKL